MKEQQQQAGVWMDHRTSILITQENEGGAYAVQGKVKANEYHGDKGEHAANKAEQADNRKYFKTIASLIGKYDEIFIFGPGKSQEEFLNFLDGDTHFKGKKITLGSSEHITDHQMIAKVRDFFNPSQA